ncbi:hypothetical protein Aperf_G00000032338 [Anoplocephala perfoliata]
MSVQLNENSPPVEEKSPDVQERKLEETPYFNAEDESGLNQLLNPENNFDDKNTAKGTDAAASEPTAEVGDADVDLDDAESEDDNFDVSIKPSKVGVYKTGNTYQARSQQISTPGQKIIRQGINLNDPGNIHGAPTIEFNIMALGDEDKPWKRPGADITDYFNYGFTEDTWMQYCEKQKIIRQEYANTALKPVLVGPAVGYNISSLSAGAHRVGMRSSQQQSQQNKDITAIGRANSPSLSEDDLDKRNGLLGPAQPLNFPPTCFPPPAGGDALSQFTSALNFPPPGFTNTSLPPPLFGSGFPTQQPGFPSLGSDLIPLFPAQHVIPGGGRNQSDSRRDKTPENIFSEDDLGGRRLCYRNDDDQESRYDRDHRSSRRSRSRSRDYHHSGRSRRYHEDSVRDFGRHSDRSSRRHGSRERRRERSRDRSQQVPPNGSSNVSSSLVPESSRSSRTDRESRRRGGEKESHRSSHRSSRHRRSSRNRSPSAAHTPRRSEPLESAINPSPTVNPLEAVSAAAADISEKLRISNPGDGVFN